MSNDTIAQDFGFAPRSAAFRANPYPVYQVLQSQKPAYYRPTQGDWLLTKYADVAQVLKSSDFGRAVPAQQPTSSLASPLLQRRAESQRLIGLWFLLQNPPEHSRLRGILSSLYTRQNTRLLQEQIQGKIDQLIVNLQDRQQIDVMNDFAGPLTMSISCELMIGIFKPDWHPNFDQWSYALSMISDLDTIPVVVEKGLLATAGLADYFRHWITQHIGKQSVAKNNLLEILYAAYHVGELNEEEMIATCIFLFMSGHTTTANLIGIIILTLLQHPTQLALLYEKPDLIPQAIAEVLRYDCIVQGVSRTALVDTILSGEKVRRGQPVHCLIAAANRDPAKFHQPDQFNITSSSTNHLAFGLGIHTCLGRHLSMSITELAIRRLIISFPTMTLSSNNLLWGDNFLGRGLKSLPIMLH